MCDKYNINRMLGRDTWWRINKKLIIQYWNVFWNLKKVIDFDEIDHYMENRPFETIQIGPCIRDGEKWQSVLCLHILDFRIKGKREKAFLVNLFGHKMNQKHHSLYFLCWEILSFCANNFIGPKLIHVFHILILSFFLLTFTYYFF